MAKKQRIEGRYIRRVRHGDNDAHDLCLTTRRPFRILLIDLSNLWGGISDAQERLTVFLLYNKQSFSFLSIDTKLAEDGPPALIFQPSEKVGCAPLFSPINGKVCASIIVNGSMNEDISEVLPLIDGNIEICFSDKLILPNKSAIKPPMYFECAKYIDQYLQAQRLHWKKFISEVRIERTPASSTQWAKYTSKSYDPQEVLKYPNKKNLLSTHHTEWRELNYVLKMCLDELVAPHTPRISRFAYKEKVEDLRRNTFWGDIVKPTELKIRTADPFQIKRLKLIGNHILHSITSENRAWSVDFSMLFERYIQYIFKLVASQIGGQSYDNNKFAISGAHRNWTLSYIEPDILIRKGNRVIVADAKYKMHLNNLYAESVHSLKDTFRHDFHQVLAYSSFEKEANKTAMIVYPCKSFTSLHQRIRSSVMGVTSDVYLVGVPWGESKDGNTLLSLNQKISATVNGIIQILYPSQ
jgi:hypothetical protein